MTEKRCAELCQQEDAEIIGTALNPDKFGGYVLFTTGKVWRSSIEKQGGLIGKMNKQLEYWKDETGKNFRIQAIRPNRNNIPDGHTLIIIYLLSDLDENKVSPITGLKGPKIFNSPDWDIREIILPTAELDMFFESNIKLKQIFQEQIIQDSIRITSESHTDVLICTHRSRDECCGIYGKQLFEIIDKKYRDNNKIRVWQSSHIKGHRTASTMLMLPDAGYWGYLHQKSEVVENIIEKKAISEDVFDGHFRGTGTLPIKAQVAEREGLKKHGWAWLLHYRRFEIENNLVRTEWIALRDENVAEILDSFELGIYLSKIKLGPSSCGDIKPIPTIAELQIR